MSAPGTPGTAPERPAVAAALDATSGSASGQAPALAAAKAPVGSGKSPALALLMALGLVGLGAVGIQEALVRSGAVGQVSWTRSAVDAADGIEAETWMLSVFIGAALVGVLVLFAALKRRPRRTLALAATTGVYLRTGDLTRMIDSLLDGADGSTDVASRVGQRKLRITATTLAPKDRNDAVEADLRQRLQPMLGALKSPPKVNITIRNEGPS